jgi:membrane protein DedA with SNARE-associated domain
VIAELVAIAAGTLVSEDLTTIAAGPLVESGQLPLVPALVACAAGIYLGDLGLWWLGHAIGPRVLRSPRVAAVLPLGGEHRFRAWFDAHTGLAIAGSRLAPGTRLPLYLAAGACRTSFPRFARWTLAVVAVWTPALIGGTFLACQQAAAVAARWHVAGHIVFLAAGTACLVVWQLGVRLLSRRGRQRLIARISRIWRWEFWPPWLFYAPVAVWTTWLAIRHGGYGTIAAANPGMPDGGVVGESKHEILARLPRSATVPSVRIRQSVNARERTDALRRRLERRGWGFPLVLKPDVGQRGSGVRIVRSLADAAGTWRG